MPPWICSNQRERERDSPTRYSRDALDSRNNTLVLILTEKPLVDIKFNLSRRNQEKRKGDIATMPENILAGTGPSEPANQGQGQPNNVPLGGDSYTTMGGPSAGSNDVSPTSSPPSLLLFSWLHEICFIFGSIFFVLRPLCFAPSVEQCRASAIDALLHLVRANKPTMQLHAIWRTLHSRDVKPRG